MPNFKIIPSTEAHAIELAANMRQADIDEIKASHGVNPLRGSVISYRLSEACFTGMVDNQVACTYGVIRRHVMSNRGMPWLLTTDLVERYAVPFLLGSRDVIARIKNAFGYLENYADIRNVVALRWLRWLGFRMSHAEPWGVERRLFQRFYWEAA